MSTTHDTIHDQVTKHPVVLYMKGTPQFPQCGFSATVAEILKRCGVTDYFSVNVLAVFHDRKFRPPFLGRAVWIVFLPGAVAADRERQ